MKKTDVNDTFPPLLPAQLFVLCMVNNVTAGGASSLELFLQGLLSAADDSELGPSLEHVPWEMPGRCCALDEQGAREGALTP